MKLYIMYIDNLNIYSAEYLWLVLKKMKLNLMMSMSITDSSTTIVPLQSTDSQYKGPDLYSSTTYYQNCTPNT